MHEEPNHLKITIAGLSLNKYLDTRIVIFFFFFFWCDKLIFKKIEAYLEIFLLFFILC